jgi:hypothetical protein
MATEEHPGMELAPELVQVMAMELEHLPLGSATESEHLGMAMESEHLETASDLEACHIVFHNQVVAHQPLPVHLNLSRNEKSKH